jgi:hypothetical protein
MRRVHQYENIPIVFGCFTQMFGSRVLTTGVQTHESSKYSSDEARFDQIRRIDAVSHCECVLLYREGKKCALLVF